MSALRRGLKVHFDLAIGELTRRQIMAAVDKIAKTGKRGAAKDYQERHLTLHERRGGERDSEEDQQEEPQDAEHHMAADTLQVLAVADKIC
jgi:hypothetical protein